MTSRIPGPHGRGACWLSLLVATSLASPAFAQEVPADPEPEYKERPKHQFLRQNEDWGIQPFFAPDDEAFFDPFKYVKLSDDGKNWATFGAQTWLRIESWENFNFGVIPASAPPGTEADDTYALWRLRLTGDFHFGESFRVFIEGKSALASDRDLIGGKRPIDEDIAALQQLFVDARVAISDDSSLILRPGRQMLQFGKQRLVSPLPWGNTLRTWDGVSALYRKDAWHVDTFATRFVPVQQTQFNTPDSGNLFYGVYATRPAKAGEVNLDAYWLGLHNDQASFNGSTGSEDRQTFGSRISGSFGSSAYDYDLEGAVQVGSLGGDDILAGMVGTEFGRRFAQTATKPRVWVGFDYGSGDSDPNDGKSGTFNQLYPLGHAYLGYIDTVGRQNVLSGSIGASCSPVERLTLAINNFAFWVPETADALYNAGGGVVRPGGGSDSNSVGYEVDLTATYALAPHVDFLLGYSHFFAGPLIEQTGPVAEDIDFLYFSVQYTF